jgi:hypothetical protein
MDSFIDGLKNRVDQMSDDNLIYLFVPEMLDRRNEALLVADYEKADQYSEVLTYVGSKINIEIYNIDNFDFIQHPTRIVPTPEEIINQKPAKNIPNN